MSFEVIPASVPVFYEDRERAMQAPISELPQLTESQQTEIRWFSLNEEEYKRLRVLPRKYAVERQQKQGTAFGRWIEKILEPFHRRYCLETVTRGGAPEGWNVIIRLAQGGFVKFQCLFDVVEAIAEGSASESQTDGLCGNILAELSQAETLKVAS